MNLVFVNQFYAPDLAPTGVKLQDLTRELVRRGHRVRVLASRHVYATAGSEPVAAPADGVEVIRMATCPWVKANVAHRIMSLLSYAQAVRHAIHNLGAGVDGVVCLTSPPLVAVPVSRACGHLGIPFAHWVMDVYPEALFAAGWLRREGLAGRYLSNRVGSALRNVPVLTLSREMAETVGKLAGREVADHAYTTESRGTGSAVQWCWLWADSEVVRDPPDDAVEDYRKQQGWLPDEKVILYSGNMGRGHDIPHLLEVVRKVQDEPGIRWVFAGAGPLESEVRVSASRLRPGLLTIMPYCPSSRLGVHLRAADIHVAGLAPGWESVMLPSKLVNSFAARRPIMLIGARNGTLEQWLKESGGGWHVPDGDTGTVRRIVQASRGECLRLGQNGRKYAEQHFHPDTRICHVADWVQACFEPVTRASHRMPVDRR